MRNSDDEDSNNFNDGQNDFGLFLEPRKQQPLPNLSSCQLIAQKCWAIHHEILQQKKKEVADQMIQLLNQFCGFVIKSEKKEKQNEQNKIRESSKEMWGKLKKQDTIGRLSKQKKEQRGKSVKRDKKEREGNKQDHQKRSIERLNIRTSKLVIPLCIRKSQAQYLESFIQYFIDRLEMFSSKGQEGQQNGQKRSRKRKQFKIMDGARKINVFTKQLLREVAPISLFIHQKIQDIHVNQKDISIFISSQATDLTSDNIYILEQGLPESSCIVILPTYSSFEDVLYTRFSKIEIIPVRLFEHKLLFCKFMYSCICDPEIKAYLPKESLSLIDDFDDFPITYREGSIRLIQCIIHLQILRQRKKKPFRSVDIKLFFKAIEKALKKVFQFFHENQIVIKKYIKCILDQKESLNILNKYLNKNSYFRREEVGENQDKLVVKLRDSLIYYFEKQQSIKQYAQFLKDANINPVKKVKPKDKDAKRLKINLQNNLDQKQLLQFQVRQAITNLTREIRSQANNFKWQQFLYLEQIKPMLNYNVYKSVSMSPVHRELLEYIQSKICTQMSKIIYVFCTAGRMKEGELMYYMKDLQMYGLIDVSESTLKPIITPAFFDKASYKTRKNG